MTEYKILLNDRIVQIEAKTYRQADPRNDKSSVNKTLYLYGEEADDPVATFPAGTWLGIYESDVGHALTV